MALKKLSSVLNFPQLAAQSAPAETSPWSKNYLPPLGTLLFLISISALMAGGLWFTAWLGAMTVAYVPLFGAAVVSVLGATFLNFWFHREITTFMLGTREIRRGFKFGEEGNERDIHGMVDDLREVVNTYFQNMPGHKPLPPIRLLCFSDDQFKIVTAEGRNPGKAVIAFSSGVFNYKKMQMTQRQLAAMILVELVLIYLHRGVGRLIVGMGTSLLSTLQYLESSNWFYSILNKVATPLKMIEDAVSKVYQKEAALIVSKKMGYGKKYIEGIDKEFCPDLKMPFFKKLKDDAEDKKKKNKDRVNYPWPWPLSYIQEWIDDNEYAEDDNSGYRLLSMLEIFVRELGYYFKELNSKKARTTCIKYLLRKEITTEDGKISLETASTEEDMRKIEEAQNKIAWELFQKRSSHDKNYPPIDPINPKKFARSRKMKLD